MRIYETPNFTVDSVEKPHVSRADGGHLKIAPKHRYVDRTQLEPEVAIELMRLTMITGEAMATALNRRGVDVGRINYQDNGNWSVKKPEGPYLHIHLYGRAKSATIHKWGEACHFPFPETGFYEGFEPLNEGDVEEIRGEMEKLFGEERYQDEKWGL